MRQKTVKVILSIIIFFVFASGLLLAYPNDVLAEVGPNLIANPSVEQLEKNVSKFPVAGKMPAGWNIDYESRNKTLNTKDLTIFYQIVGGHNSRHAISATVYMERSLSYGARGWFFDEISIDESKKYVFSNYYRSNTISYATANFKLSNGEYVSAELGFIDPSRNWKEFKATIIPPKGAVSITVVHHLKSRGYLTTDDYYLGETNITPVPPPPPPASDNLILNPSLESGATAPDNWNQGNWGTNNAAFIFPIAGRAGKGAEINVSSYTDGDAKWYFDDIAVSPGEKYVFSDYYKSTAPTRVAARFTLSNGTYLYLDFGYPLASGDWNQFSYSFVAPQNAVSLTVFHLIESVGYLAVDDFSLIKETQSGTPFSQGMVTLSFDDGWQSTYQNAIPILNNHGIKSTQYIFTDALGTAGYIAVPQMLDMQNQGHEIAAHSKTHSDLTTLTNEQIIDEVLGSKQELENLGVNSTTSFAYPYGTWNENIKNIVKQSGYKGARTALAQDSGFNYADQDPYLLKTFSIEVDTAADKVQQIISQAVQNKTWVILVFHQIENSGGQYSTTPQNLESIANFISANKVKTVTIGQGLAELAQ